MNSASARIRRESLLDLHHRYLRSAVCLELSGWVTLRATGADAQSLLHNLCTNKVRDLPSGRGCETFFTDVKGKIVGHGFLLVDAHQVLMLLPPCEPQTLLQHLDKYVIREDVAFQELSSEFAWFALQPPDQDPVRQDPAFDHLWAYLTKTSATGAVVVVNSQLPSPGSIWIGGVRPEVELAIAENWEMPILSGEDAQQALETLRLENVWPWFDRDFDHRNLPQEVARNEQAISFHKGCYLGQETVARIDALGHVNRMLAAVRFEGDIVPTAGDTLCAEGQEAGRVTSAAWSPKHQAPLALAMLRRGSSEPGVELVCGAIRGKVVALR